MTSVRTSCAVPDRCLFWLPSPCLNTQCALAVYGVALGDFVHGNMLRGVGCRSSQRRPPARRASPTWPCSTCSRTCWTRGRPWRTTRPCQSLTPLTLALDSLGSSWRSAAMTVRPCSGSWMPGSRCSTRGRGALMMTSWLPGALRQTRCVLRVVHVGSVIAVLFRDGRHVADLALGGGRRASGSCMGRAAPARPSCTACSWRLCGLRRRLRWRWPPRALLPC